MVDSDDLSDCDLKLQINADYASRYDRWRSKEELQRLKAKYGDVKLDDVSESESSSSEEEDEDAEALTPQLEKDFLRTLAALKSRDPKIYNENVKFFNVQNESRSVQIDKVRREAKKVKPMFLKDYEREVIVEHGGKFIDDDDDDDENESDPERNAPPGYFEEQENIRQSLKKTVEGANEGPADELLSVRVKTDEEQAREEADYMEWLKGQKEELSEDRDIAVELDPLRKFWTDPKLAEGERFLRDYLLNKQYLDDNDDDRIPSYDEIIRDLEDDEKELEKEEQFEKKYNFRFEEPDAELIKSYPRVIPETLRNRDTRRIKSRQAARERKLLEKEKKREELKRLKNLKKKEILEKIDKLKEITGNPMLGFTDRDVEGDFNEEEYDQMMKKVFDADYYEQQVDDVKPVFSDDEGAVENWDEWQPSAGDVNGTEGTTGNTGDGEGVEDDGDGELNDGLYCEDPDFVMDADYDPSLKRVKEKKKKGRRRATAAAAAAAAAEVLSQSDDGVSKKKKSKFAAALEKPKPVFDGKSKFEEYFDEYYGLDYEDVIGDLPVRFKYRKVVPNDFGLSVDEVLAVPDKELNAWVSVKKMSQYRPEDEETRDVVVFQRKKNKKFNVLPSLREPEPEDIEQVESSNKRKKKKRKRSATSAAASTYVGNTERDSKQNEESKVSDKPPKKKRRKHSDQLDDFRENPTTSPKKSELKQANSTTAVDSDVDTQIDTTTDVKTSLDRIKAKKSKKRRNIADNVTDDGTETDKKVARESAENVDETKEKKNRKKNRRKLPTISDDRLKAYGIDPKKYKYFHSKKLLQLPVNRTGS